MEKWAAKHEYEELKDGVWLKPTLTLLRRGTREEWTDKHHDVARKLALGGGWKPKRLFDIGWSTKANTKDVAIGNTDCIIAEVETKSDVRSQRLSESGSKKREPQRWQRGIVEHVPCQCHGTTSDSLSSCDRFFATKIFCKFDTPIHPNCALMERTRFSPVRPKWAEEAGWREKVFFCWKVKDGSQLCISKRQERQINAKRMKEWKWTEMRTARRTWTNEKRETFKQLREIVEFTDLFQEFVVDLKENWRQYLQ